jgi:hypothetical protein
LVVFASAAVTTTEIVFAPSARLLAPVPETVAPELAAVAATVTLATLFATMALYEIVSLANFGLRAPLLKESALSVASVEGVVVVPGETLGWQDAKLSTARTARREKGEGRKDFQGDDENLILTSGNTIVIYEESISRFMRCQ